MQRALFQTVILILVQGVRCKHMIHVSGIRLFMPIYLQALNIEDYSIRYVQCDGSAESFTFDDVQISPGETITVSDLLLFLLLLHFYASFYFYFATVF